jgi:hypothetical protein
LSSRIATNAVMELPAVREGFAPALFQVGKNLVANALHEPSSNCSRFFSQTPTASYLAAEYSGSSFARSSHEPHADGIKRSLGKRRAEHADVLRAFVALHGPAIGGARWWLGNLEDFDNAFPHRLPANGFDHWNALAMYYGAIHGALYGAGDVVE